MRVQDKTFFESSYFELASEMVMYNIHAKSFEMLKIYL